MATHGTCVWRGGGGGGKRRERSTRYTGGGESGLAGGEEAGRGGRENWVKGDTRGVYRLNVGYLGGDVVK